MSETNKKKQEMVSVPFYLLIISLLFPPFGLIYWAIKHKKEPFSAKKCLCLSLISAGIFIFFIFLLWICILAILFMGF